MVRNSYFRFACPPFQKLIVLVSVDFPTPKMRRVLRTDICRRVGQIGFYMEPPAFFGEGCRGKIPRAKHAPPREPRRPSGPRRVRGFAGKMIIVFVVIAVLAGGRIQGCRIREKIKNSHPRAPWFFSSFGLKCAGWNGPYGSGRNEGRILLGISFEIPVRFGLSRCRYTSPNWRPIWENTDSAGNNEVSPASML